MTESTLIQYLKIIGWGSVIGYPILILSQLFHQSQLLLSLDSEADSYLTLAHLLGAIVDAPLSLALPVLCLFSATYLSKKPETLKEIFE